jgi:tRNA1(Val) A37 N6-methylase TrmN6
MVLTSEPDEIFVLNKRVRLLQMPAGEGFRTSLDSVMLAAAVPAKSGDKILDMGAGVGGATFCLLHRVEGIHVTGVEWERAYYDLALKNIPLNHAEGKVDFIHSDMRDYQVEGKPIYTHVMVNPPFNEAGQHMPSPDIVKAKALGHLEADLSLEDWILAGYRLVKSGGSFTIIYPTSGTDKIIRAMGKKFGAIEIIPLWPRVGVDSKRVIIRAIKGRHTPCVIRAGLVLHEADGRYTSEANKVLRDAGVL